MYGNSKLTVNRPQATLEQGRVHALLLVVLCHVMLLCAANLITTCCMHLAHRCSIGSGDLTLFGNCGTLVPFSSLLAVPLYRGARAIEERVMVS